MTRSQELRSKAPEALRAGRRDAIIRQRPMSAVFLAIAESYKRLAALDLQLRAWRVPVVGSPWRVAALGASTQPSTECPPSP